MTGDGIDDLYTGCFEGGIYVLAGSKPGEFAAPQKLLDKAGNVLRLGQYWDYEKKNGRASRTASSKTASASVRPPSIGTRTVTWI